jgi:hypothetical protein
MVKGKNNQPVDDGSKEIARAERRLASALAAVDAARDKAARRERKLARLLERYGRLPVVADTEPSDMHTAQDAYVSGHAETTSAAEGDAGNGIESAVAEHLESQEAAIPLGDGSDSMMDEERASSGEG